jgi:parallel beta-helix repeat protein
MQSGKTLAIAGASLISCWQLANPAVANSEGLNQPQEKIPQRTPPTIKPSIGARFESEAGGSPNTLSGYFFLPLSQNKAGGITFLDLFANLGFDSPFPQKYDAFFGLSSRLGYRWLGPHQNWILGINAGIDTQPAYSDYTVQAGVGLEALNRSLELRLNGYIPITNSIEQYATGWTNAELVNNQLILDGFNRYVVSLGGVNIEAGVPLKQWKSNSLWAYAAYYYLDGDYIRGSSGVRARAELKLGNQLSVGGTVSYDEIFQTQATGYIRFGANPIGKTPLDVITQAEQSFLAQRGLPVVRDIDLRMTTAQVEVPDSVAINRITGQSYIVRCAGNTNSDYVVRCSYGSLDALLNAANGGDVLMAGGALSADLSTRSPVGGRPTLRLEPGTQLVTSGNAPTLATQFGPANLNPIFGVGVGSQPLFSNGVISIGNNSTISGFTFANTSITNYSTSNVLISNNSFTGSYTDNPTPLATAQAFGNINVSANALPAIELSGVENLTINNNTFLYPQVQTYVSQRGTIDRGDPDPDGDGKAAVCNQNGSNTSGLCLSGNAIRLDNSSNTTITKNTVAGALDEAFRINNPSGNLLIDGNTIFNMRMGPDSNIGTAIIIGQNHGTSNIRITNNTFSNNSQGIYPVVTNANQRGVAVATTGLNNIDPIEIGLCRGSDNYPRAADLYADPGFSGNCSQPASMTVIVAGNTISLPFITTGIRQDGDGIDVNLGSNSMLFANIFGNKIETLGGRNGGDNGITFDVRGNAQATGRITNNLSYDVGDEAIDLGFTNTANANKPGFADFILSGNTLSGTTKGLVNVTLINNPGKPVSEFYVTGLGENARQVAETKPEYNDFNSGSYPNLYLNGELYIRP